MMVEYDEPVILLPDDSTLGKCSACDFVSDVTIILGANTNRRQLINLCADCVQMISDKLSSYIEEGFSDLDGIEDDDGNDGVNITDIDSGIPESIPYGDMRFTQEEINENESYISNDAQFVEEDPNIATPSTDCVKPIECEGD